MADALYRRPDASTHGRTADGPASQTMGKRWPISVGVCPRCPCATVPTERPMEAREDAGASVAHAACYAKVYSSPSVRRGAVWSLPPTDGPGVRSDRGGGLVDRR